MRNSNKTRDCHMHAAIKHFFVMNDLSFA